MPVLTGRGKSFIEVTLYAVWYAVFTIAAEIRNEGRGRCSCLSKGYLRGHFPLAFSDLLNVPVSIYVYNRPPYV